MKNVTPFWLGLGVVVLSASLLTLATYRFSLPYIDHADEPAFYLQAQIQRGLFETDAYILFAGYPPGYLGFQRFIAQPLLEAVGVSGLAATVEALRLLSVVLNAVTLIALAVIARSAFGGSSGDVAGWAAAAVYGFAPLVVENAVYAIPDPFVAAAVAVSAACYARALAALQRRQPALFRVGTGLIVGAAAFLFKYTAAPILVPGGIMLVVLLSRRHIARRWLIVLLGVVVILSVSALASIARVLRDASPSMIADLLGGALNPARVITNLTVALAPVLTPGIGVLVLAALLLSVVSKRWPDRSILALALFLVVTIPWAAAVFAEVTLNERLRDVLPATALFCALIGIAIGQIAAVVSRRMSARTAAAWGVGLAGLVLIVVPQTVPLSDLVRQRTVPDRRIQMRAWVNESIEPGVFAVSRGTHKVFNPFWGGLTGSTWINWHEYEVLDETTVAGWREQGIDYALVPDRLRVGVPALDDLLLLRDFDAPEMGGEPTALYRLRGLQHAVEAHFGDRVTLIGYDRSDATDHIALRFYWRVESATDAPLSLFVHVTPLDSRDSMLAQVDGGLAPITHPPSRWAVNETLISPLYTLALPNEVVERTALWIGVYNYETGVRERMPNGEDSYLMAIDP